MKFLISILSMRLSSGVEECIESVLKGGGDFALHLTSNGNAEVRTYFLSLLTKCRIKQRITVDHNPANMGFIAPNSRAFLHADLNNYDVFVMLNDDCVVPPGWLDKIEAEFSRHPAAAIVGASHTCCTIGENCHGYESSRLDYVDGACCAVRVDVIRKHFKSQLFPAWLPGKAYGEDATLSLEVRKRGFTIHQAPFMVEHKRGSTSQHVPEAAAWQEANHAAMKERFGFYLKHGKFPGRLVIRRWAALGDVLLVTAILPELWRTNPLSEIVVETCAPEIFDDNPHVRFAARSIGRRPDDQVIDLDMVSENGVMRHFVASYARACGIEVERPYETEIHWRAEHDRFANDAWFRGGDPIVALHTGPSTWRAKEWPAVAWTRLQDELEMNGWRIALVGNGKLQGAPGAKQRSNDRWRDYRDKTANVNELAALIAKCRLFIGIDSFLLHVAGAVGTPSIGLFGITSSKFVLTAENAVGIDADPLLWTRAGERHRVAGVTHIEEDGSTIGSLTVAQVLEAVEKLCPAKVGA